METKPSRFREDADKRDRVPVHVVWELTLACNLACLHCGSRAGRRRPNELSFEECVRVIDDLAQLGTREISLIGGEAYLRPDWVDIIRAIAGHGIYCALQTGGRNLDQRRLAAAAEAGLTGVGVSIDGAEEVHDRLRGVRGSFEQATGALRIAKSLGLRTSVNTQLCSENWRLLPTLLDVVRVSGATHWQVQLTVAMGNAADNPSLLLQPYQIPDVLDLLAEVALEAGHHDILVVPGSNVGYFGPWEWLWRGYGESAPHWTGCPAGETVIGLEADGTVKGCPSLETGTFRVGNVRDSLPEVWKAARPVAREITPTGFCGTCYYREVCRAGCTWTGHSLSGEQGDNPMCGYRALRLREAGIREVVERLTLPSAAPFGIGRFRLKQVDSSGAEVRFRGDAAGTRAGRPRAGESLTQCGSCLQFHGVLEETCPFCDATADESARAVRERAEAMNAVEREILTAEHAIPDDRSQSPSGLTHEIR